MKKLFVVLVMLAAINANAQWEPDLRLTYAPADSWTSGNKLCVAANGSNVHAVWTDIRDGNYEIYYKHSTNFGVTWGADSRLTNNNQHSENPSIALSGLFVHIVWGDSRDGNYEIYYKRSTDAGIIWGADVRLTNTATRSFSPSIAISGSTVHVVWYDYDNGMIYYKRSTDTGITWGVDIRLTDINGASDYSFVAVSGSVVHVVWEDFRDGNSEIYYKSSTDAGVSWGTDKRLTNNSAVSVFPSVAVSGSIVHVVWLDARDGNDEIYYKRSTDSGVSWGADIRLTNNISMSEFPSVAVSGSVVHVVWYDHLDGNDEIYYKSSTDAGVSWGADTRLTNSTAFSQFPSVAISGSIVHVIWEDNRDGNFEIYYKRDPTGNPIGIQNISSEIPSKYSLSQNFPNPFNSSSKFKFQISKLGNVKISVYNVQGREVQTLVNERLQPGTYEATFDGSMLNSGVYFYKISSGDFSETKKMTLIK